MTAPFVKRLLIFLIYWWGIVPGFFYFSRDQFHLTQYARFTYSTAITPLLFFLIIASYQKELFKFKYPKPNNKSIIFSLLSLCCIGAYLALYPFASYLIIQKQITDEWIFLGLVSGTRIAIFTTAFIAIFSWKWVRKFHLLVKLFFGFNALYYTLFFSLFPHWGFFSKQTGILTYPLLKQLYPSTQLVVEGNNVGIFIDTFRVGLGEACSGVMLILLFIVLYSAVCFIRPTVINQKQGVLFLLLGTIGAFLLNVIRVFLLMVIGTRNPDFAMGLFHTNATWILFVGYFLIYLSLTYPHLLRKSIIPVNSI